MMQIYHYKTFLSNTFYAKEGNGIILSFFFLTECLFLTDRYANSANL